MKIKALKKLLHNICDRGYKDWVVYFCDDDDDDYTVNHIYVDDDGDICLESTDMEGDNYDMTAEDMLKRIKRYDNDEYVYFLEEYYDGSSTGYGIEFNWYIGHDDYGNEILNIDCSEMDDEDDDYYDEDDGPLPSTIDCPNCTGKAKWDGEFYRCKRCGFCGDSSFG